MDTAAAGLWTRPPDGTWSAKAKRPNGVRRNCITFIGYALIVVVAAVSTLVGGEALFVVHLIAALAVVMGSIFLGAMNTATTERPTPRRKPTSSARSCVEPETHSDFFPLPPARKEALYACSRV